MKAVVLRRPKALELIEVAEPVLSGDDQVLIRVMACGVCGSDLRYWAGENPWALHTLGRHVDNPANIILGHEFAGIVARVNSAKHEHLLGRRVGVQAYRVCGACRFCRSGRHNLCRQTIHLGHAQGWGSLDLYPGAYAEYCPAWGDLLYPMPDEVSFEEAAMADILCVAVHVVGRASLHPGAAVLCVGGGPIGLCVAQVAKTMGAGKVFVAEPSPLARQVAERIGGLVVFDSERERPADVLAASLGQPEVAAVYDSVGSRETIENGIPLLEESGTYVNLAVHDTPVTLNGLALGSERTVTTSSNAFYSDVAKAYELIFSRKVDVASMITHRFKLEEHQQAFDLLLQVPKGAYKVMFNPCA